MKPRKHVIYGWTARRSRLTKMFRWERSYVSLLDIGNDAICRTKGRKHSWCAADWPPKRVKVTVEDV